MKVNGHIQLTSPCCNMESNLWRSNPDSLDYLEDRGTDHDKYEESLKIEKSGKILDTLLWLKLTINSGLTGYFSSVFEVLVTFPLLVTFLAFFSFAFLICGVLGILMDISEMCFLINKW